MNSTYPFLNLDWDINSGEWLYWMYKTPSGTFDCIIMDFRYTGRFVIPDVPEGSIREALRRDGEFLPRNWFAA